MSDDKVDPITRARQAACPKHPDTIIRHMSDPVARCPFCGISMSDYEAMREEAQWGLAPPQVMGGPYSYGGAGSGNTPYSQFAKGVE